ncbi:MAG: amidase [Betaproteobacteria bacterium]|nr:amidase [Betaproteobacteria bacterium]
MSEETGFLPVTELIGRFRRKSLSPVDAVGTAFDRIRLHEPKINAFCRVADEAACMRQARESEARWQRGEPMGALDGVPISVKDAILAKGWPTLKGSRLVNPDQDWNEDAPAVARLREHGAIIIGKTTTPEFNWKGVTDSPLSGITRNPWNLQMTPGGSSGGAAAALAAGIGNAAIGSDAGGSVRIPGSLCALVALKASAGRVPNYPASPLGSMSHIGPITRTVADAALLLNVMSEPDARDWLSLPRSDADFRNALSLGVKGLKIAYSPTLGYARVQPEVARLVEKAVKVFEELGAHVELNESPFADPTRAFRIHFYAGVAHSMRMLPDEQMELLDPDLLKLVKQARRIRIAEYLGAVDERATLGAGMRQFHERYDLLLTPTLAVTAFAAGKLAPRGYGNDWMNWTPFTYPFNMTGQPAATVPCGFTKKGLPVGLQIVGPMYQDALVLRAGHAYESAVPAMPRRPAL